MGMYEALSTAAGACDDAETERLARQLLQEERDDHRLAWSDLQETARASAQLALSEAQ
jgi:hypothetical protein